MPILASSLSQLFNLPRSIGQFPDSWKVARVAPIYKDGPTDDRSNYRPILVLPVVARLFEKLIYEQFYSYLNENNLLFSGQSGFRSHNSVLTSLLHCTNDWYLNLDKEQYTSVTFIDLKKAFDTVDHQILLQKIRVYGIEGKEYHWFLSYLKNRKQCCKVNGRVSNLDDIKYGVPQGSCLGPLLFLIYINDLPLSLKFSKVNMYADDAIISFSANSIYTINNAVNEYLMLLKTWLDENKPSLNVTKTQSLLIGSRYRIKALERPDSTKLSLSIGEELISSVAETKYLGLQVDQYLSWDQHILLITKQISKVIGMLQYVKQYLPLKIIQTMYTSLIEPYFKYCCPVWGWIGTTTLQKLQKLQNRAARVATKSCFDAPSESLIQHLGWLTIEQLIELETAKVVYKALHNEAPPYMNELFLKLSITQCRELRNSSTDL